MSLIKEYAKSLEIYTRVHTLTRIIVFSCTVHSRNSCQRTQNYSSLIMCSCCFLRHAASGARPVADHRVQVAQCQLHPLVFCKYTRACIGNAIADNIQCVYTVSRRKASSPCEIFLQYTNMYSCICMRLLSVLRSKKSVCTHATVCMTLSITGRPQDSD